MNTFISETRKEIYVMFLGTVLPATGITGFSVTTDSSTPISILSTYRKSNTGIGRKCVVLLLNRQIAKDENVTVNYA